MVQMTRAALQVLVDRDILENTTGLITATKVNDVLTDIVDSMDVLPSGALLPFVRTFLIDGQATKVDAGTDIGGAASFLYNINEPGNVDGNLSLTQDLATLSSSVDPAGTSVGVVIPATVLTAGQSSTFTLSGTDTIGPNNFSRDFVVTAYTDDEYVYINAEADRDPSDFVIGNATRTPFSGTRQNITIPNYSGGRYITICQKASEPQLTGIIIDSWNQLGAFERFPNAFQSNSENFDAYVSNNLIVGATVSGDTITLER